ncbi:3797_t:CDS:2, partial [Funneliformis geosporum]
LSSINTVPPHFDAISVKGGANNSTLFLYGGRSRFGTTPLVNTFDPQSNSWTTPKITGIDPIRKFELRKAIVDNSGTVFVRIGERLVAKNEIDMLILDTVNLSFGKGSVVGASPRCQYGSALLPSRKIIYLGGYDNDAKDNNALTLNE